jgi:hypothetical protein
MDAAFQGFSQAVFSWFTGLEHVSGAWRAAEPLNAWLDRHVGPSTEPPAERYGRARRR